MTFLFVYIFQQIIFLNQIIFQFQIFGFKKLVRDYDVLDQAGFAGTYGLWQLHNGFHKKTNTNVTIWVLEKRPIEKLFFKKDAQSFKRFIELMKIDAIPPQQITAGPKIYERVSEDSYYLVYVTERIIGSLQSLYYYYGDLTFAKVNSFNDASLPPVPFASPDLVLLGLTTLANDLNNLHQAGIVHSNITPSNIVLTSSNTWKLAGFAFCEAQCLQFEFSNDYNSYFRPSAAYMTEKMTRQHCSDKTTDICQIFNSVFSVFGNKQNFCDISDFIGKKNNAISEDTLLANVCEKLHGVAIPGAPNSLTPQMASKIAMQNTQFWNDFVQQADIYYSLKELRCVAQIAQVGDNATIENLIGALNTHILAPLFLSYNMSVKNQVFTKVQSENTKYAIEFLTQMQKLITQKILTLDFLLTFTPAVIKLLAFKDYHNLLIPLIISIGEQLQIPNAQVFLLFEPIIITLTQAKYRSIYPLTKQGPYQAFTGIKVPLYEGKVAINLRYNTPYIDYPLEKGFREKDRNAMAPTIDKEINTNVYDNIISVFLQQLPFLLNGQTGGRSHYYSVNFLLSCINSTNDIISSSAMNCLSGAVQFMNDDNWMIPEDQTMSTTFAKNVQAIGDKFTGLSEQAKQEEEQKTVDSTIPRGIQQYKQPLINLFTPSISQILLTDTNQTKIYNALICLASISNYFSDDQLVRILLPAVNDSLDKNVAKYPLGITGVAQFIKQIYQRCSGKTVANVFMRALFKMVYGGVLTEKNDLLSVRSVLEELWQFINNDLYNKDVSGPQIVKIEQQTQNVNPEQAVQKQAQQIAPTSQTQQAVTPVAQQPVQTQQTTQSQQQNQGYTDYMNYNYDYQSTAASGNTESYGNYDFTQTNGNERVSW